MHRSGNLLKSGDKQVSYDNTNSGVLFKNDKEGNEKRPDYTGKIDVGGTEMRLAAWLREGKSGKFLSLKVSEMESRKPATDLEDDVPF